MKTVNAREIVDSIVRNRKDILKDHALTAKVSESKPWCEGAEKTVLVEISADWFGRYTIRCENDAEVWSVTIHGGHRLHLAATV